MFLTLDIESITASWRTGKIDISFIVVPADHSHLDLRTGEIFQNDRCAKLRMQENKRISAQLLVTSHVHNSSGEQIPSEMRYFRGIEGEVDSHIALLSRRIGIWVGAGWQRNEMG